MLLETLIHDGAFGDGAEVIPSRQKKWGDSKEVVVAYSVRDLFMICM